MARARLCVRFLPVMVFASLFPIIGNAQPFSEQNVNMVSGIQWPGGDPFLRQQNEPSLAVSTRNPLHLLAVANDYRSVDIPFNAPAGPDNEERGDAWLGVFKSKDGGNKWLSILLDGYPQQGNGGSPLNGFQAAADGVVRAGNNGMFYMTGIVLNRGNNPASGILLARFIDNNNSEVGDPIVGIDTKLIDRGTSGQFIDKPWLAVGPGTSGGQCTLAGQMFPAQNVYLAYTVFVGNDNNVRTKIMFARSTDCGATWSTQKLSEMYAINQGPTIAIDPSNPNKVYVAWRRFKGGNDSDSIIFTKSTDGGATFTKGAVATNITPFEQGTTGAAIRTNAYPAMAVDGSGRIYLGWSQRDVNGDGRIVLINSTDGATWSSPVQVSPILGGTSNGRGHQFMPTITFSAGKLTLAWYDLRQDHTVGVYQKDLVNPAVYDESRAITGNLYPYPGQPTVVFWQFLSDTSPDPSIKLVRRHTLEVFAAESTGGAMPSFTTTRVSRYKFGSAAPSLIIQDLQINPPNLPMFRQGTVPFFGDYIDLAAYNSPVSGPTSTVPTRVRHVVWTDNRDVRAPLGSPPDWTKYTPVHYGIGSTSIFDPSQTRPPCTVDPLSQQSPYAGTRNQNIYTSRVTDGMFAGSPGNAKPLGVIQRAFTVFVQNARNTVAFYHLLIVRPLPANTAASFHQFDPADFEDVAIPAHSTATRTVFVTGPPHSRVDVSVTEITMVGGTEVPGGLSTDVGLNTDPQNPDIGNPDPSNPDIGNQEVFNPDIGNPDIGNPDIGNPDIGNPDIGNPDIGNPDIGNPDIGNPDIGNPDIGNPDIGNPDIGNPDIGNQSVSDTNIPAHNGGNTTGGYTVKLLKNGDLPPSVTGTQLILSKTYDTPAARGCEIGVEHHRQIITSVKNPPVFTNPGDVTDPSLDDPNSSTMWLAPGETGNITLRLIGTFPRDMKIDASQFITPVSISHAVNTADAAAGIRLPRTSLLTITNPSVNDAVTGQPYTMQFNATGGIRPYSWRINFPEGFTINSTGLAAGVFFEGGDASISVTVTDSETHPYSVTRQYFLNVADPLAFALPSIPAAVQGSPYQVTLGSSGGFAPIHWTLASGSLPAGLSLGDDGTISGMATTVGTSHFQARITDSSHPAQTLTSPLEQLDVVAPPVGCGSTVSVLFNNFNIDAVSNGAASAVFSTAEGVSNCLDSIVTYHWNNAQGSTPGTIALRGANRQPLGPWQAVGSSGQGGAPNVVWTATPPANAPVVLNGSYTVLDSNPETWSQNEISSGIGFTKVYVRSYTPGTLQFVTQPHSAAADQHVSDDIVVSAKDASGAALSGIQVQLSQSTAICPSSIDWNDGSLPIVRTTDATGQAHFGALIGRRGCYGLVLNASTANLTASAVSNAFDVFGFGDYPFSIATRVIAYTTTRLSDGRILVAGGQGTSGVLNSAEVLDPATKTWQSVGNMTTPRTAHTATLLNNGKVLMAGGNDGTAFTTSLELFDPATNTFSAAGSLNTARGLHTATLRGDGSVVFIGGINPTELTSAEVYDPATGQVSTLNATLNHPRSAHTATLLSDGTIVILGGGATAANRQAVEILTDGVFLLAGTLGEGRIYHSSTLLPNGKILVAGGVVFFGTDNFIISSNAEIYDPAAGSTSALIPMVDGQSHQLATLLDDGTVILAGGNKTSSPGVQVNVDTVQLFDPATSTFISYGHLSSPTFPMQAAIVPGTPTRFIGVGGSQHVEIFYPKR